MSLTFDQFKDKAAKILNLNLDGYKLKRVQRRTDSLMHRYNITDYSQCLTLLQTDQKFREAYLNHFTINTSEFFRNPGNFNYLQENIFPTLFQHKDKIKIWSAPCSNGSEPYTIAIILSELNIKLGQSEILASDLDPNVLRIAKKGIYEANFLQNIPSKILNKYFSKLNDNSNKYQLDKKIMNQVSFEKRDLINLPYRKNWDLILCRNFFIYLTKALKEELINKFSLALNPGGYLFLGNTEFIFNPQKFGLEKVYSSLYRKIA